MPNTIVLFDIIKFSWFPEISSPHWFSGFGRLESQFPETLQHFLRLETIIFYININLIAIVFFPICRQTQREITYFSVTEGVCVQFTCRTRCRWRCRGWTWTAYFGWTISMCTGATRTRAAPSTRSTAPSFHQRCALCTIGHWNALAVAIFTKQ